MSDGGCRVYETTDHILIHFLETFPRLATLVSVLRSTLTWVSSTIQESVSSVWTCESLAPLSCLPHAHVISFVVMGRPGLRVARRKAKTGRVGFPHKVKPEQ